MTTTDTTIRFRRSQWHALPERAKIYIGQLCGPLYPDRDGVLTLTVSVTRWAEIEAMIREGTHTDQQGHNT